MRLGDVEAVLPDAVAYPYFDRTLGDAFVKESELFFDSMVREDRSVLDLLTADYSFVNERIARRYGYPNVTGNAFRRVDAARAARDPDARQCPRAHVGGRPHVAGDARQVGDGSDDGLAAAGAARRLPAFEATKGEVAGKVLTVRERMETHRANPPDLVPPRHTTSARAQCS